VNFFLQNGHKRVGDFSEHQQSISAKRRITILALSCESLEMTLFKPSGIEPVAPSSVQKALPSADRSLARCSAPAFLPPAFYSIWRAHVDLNSTDNLFIESILLGPLSKPHQVVWTI
jgi:hypothetical protein